MIAYTIAEALDESSIVIHFEKGCPLFKGVYQAINQIFLEQCCQGFQTVNREQDLGDEGLRKAKLSYNPVAFLKKYRVCLKGGSSSRAFPRIRSPWKGRPNVVL